MAEGWLRTKGDRLGCCHGRLSGNLSGWKENAKALWCGEMKVQVGTMATRFLFEMASCL